MSATERWIIKDNTNGVSPTGLTSPVDSPTAFRNCAHLLSRIAQGAASGNLSLALNPVAALATVNTTNGSETANDTLTVANTAITLKASGATGNQANIAAGTAGTSTGAASPAITATGLAVNININGDGAQILNFTDGGTHTGSHIASVLQTNVRALTPNNALNAVAFSAATVTYSTSGYVFTSGVAGSNSTVVITDVPGNAGAANLKLGVNHGAAEAAGTATTLNNIATLINGAASAWAGICSAFVCGANLTLTAAIPGLIGNGLALAVSSTGSTMTITHAFGASVAGTEGTAAVFALGQ